MTARAATDKQIIEEGKERMGAGIKNVFWHMYGRDDARREGQAGHSFTSLDHVKRIDPVIFGMRCFILILTLDRYWYFYYNALM